MLSTLMTLAGVMLTVVALTAQTAPIPRPTPPPPPGPPPSPVNGKAIFNKIGCSQCHGAEGQGGAAGPRLGPRPVPLAALTAYVRKPAGDMPPYTAKVLSDRDLADIHAFLTALPAPKAVETIPLLSGR